MFRRVTVLAGCLCLLTLGATASASDFVTSVVDPYLRIQSALAADTMTGVKADAAAIVKVTSSMGARAAGIRTAAAEVQGATTIAAARVGFGKLSNAMIEYGRANKGALGASTRKAYCPMEKQYWLQKGETIANPYAGKRMLRCGEFKAL